MGKLNDNMPDTRQNWRAQLHTYIRQNGATHYAVLKERFPHLKNANNRTSNWSAFKSFLESKWFKKNDYGDYYARGVWHESRYFGDESRRRKDDIEYAICSLLQNYGPLTTDGIKERLQLRSNREPHATHLSRLCQMSNFIRSEGRVWVFNYSNTQYEE